MYAENHKDESSLLWLRHQGLREGEEGLQGGEGHGLQLACRGR